MSRFILSCLLLIAVFQSPQTFSQVEVMLAPKDKKSAAEVTEVNSKVSRLEQQIKSQQTGDQGIFVLEVSHGATNTEGVPPSFKYYYEFQGEKPVLCACRIHVGHETWSNDFDYFFDSNEKVLKYRKLVKGREDKPEPLAIIYSKSGAVIWKNTEKPNLEPIEILTNFKTLIKQSNAFASY